MAILKVIEVMGQSDQSWDHAAKSVVTEASKTLKNIRSLYVKEMTAKVENDKIVEYRINGKVTFEINK